MQLKITIAVALVVSMFMGLVQAYAHSGGTDENGCHNDRKRGGYHCH